MNEYFSSTTINKIKWTNCIPNLQLNWLTLNINCFCTKFNTNCQIMNWLESLILELKKKAWFTNCNFSNNNILEYILILWFWGFVGVDNWNNFSLLLCVLLLFIISATLFLYIILFYLTLYCIYLFVIIYNNLNCFIY